MAVTKIWSIKKTVQKAINYITDPAKTDGGVFVSGFGVAPETAALEFQMTADFVRLVKGGRAKGENEAYHMIQSFSPEDKIDETEAHEIGIKWAKEILGDDYDFVIATHNDKGHIHNHVIFNAYSEKKLKKFRTQPFRTAQKLRTINDRLCHERALSVIPFVPRPENYYDYKEKEIKKYWKAEASSRVNFVLDRVTEIDEFKTELQKLHIVFNEQNNTYQYEGYPVLTSDQLKGIDSDPKQILQDNLVWKERMEKAVLESVAAPETINFESFKKQLAEKYGVEVKCSKKGILSYLYEDTSCPKVLPEAFFTVKSVSEAIAQKSAENLIKHQTDLAETYTLYQKNKKPNEIVSFVIPENEIITHSKHGVLLKYQEGSVFVPFSKGNDQGSVAFGRNYSYRWTDADGKKEKYFSGNELIAHFYREATQLEIGSHNIAGIGNNGITITVENFGIKRLFIDKSDVISISPAGAVISLYQPREYQYHTFNGERSSIKGSDLAQLLKNEPILSNSNDSVKLEYKLRAATRRSALRSVKAMTDALVTYRKNNAQSLPEMSFVLEKEQHDLAVLNDEEAKLSKKLEEYQSVYKYLSVYQKYLPMWREAQKRILGKQAFTARHQQEIKSFEIAKNYLMRNGIKSDIPLDSVKNLMEKYQQEIKQLKKQISAKEKEVRSILQSLDELATSHQERNLSCDMKKS